MLENIRRSEYYKLIVFVVKPERKFLLFRKVYGVKGLLRHAKYLENRKPIYYIIEYKDGSQIKIIHRHL